MQHVTAGDLPRIREIARVLAQNGLGRYVLPTALGRFLPEREDERLADAPWTVRVRQTLVDLGPTFVKLGQVLSVRPDIVPVALARELESLLDRVDPVPAAEILAVVEDELGAPADEIFSFFDQNALASASIAQVHRARLQDDTDVAVKVQRPDIERIIGSDLRILYTLARLLEGEVSLPGIHTLVDIVTEFDSALHQEMDFHREAENCERFRNALAESHPHVHVPRTFGQHSSRRVLTLELCEGEPATTLTAADPRAPGFARTLLDCTLSQAFEAGLFHGDPHPGNLLVRPDGGLVYLDFGLVGTLTAENQQVLSSIFTALVFRDAESLTLSIYHAGGTEGRVDLKAFRREVDRLMEKYNGAALSDFADRANLLEIVEVAARYRITLPREFAVLARTAALSYGLTQKLLPEVDIFEEVRPIAQRLMARQLAPDRMAGEVARLLLHAQAAMSRIPIQANQILADLEDGSLQVQVRDPEAEASRQELRWLGLRVSLALCAAGLAVAGAVMIAPLDARIGGVPVVPVAGLLTLLSGTLVWASLVAHTHLADRLAPRALLRAALRFLWGRKRSR